jgi:ferrochelatase
VADHVETLYDIDVEAAELARELGFRSCRRMPGMDLREDFIDALESVARPLL